MAVFPIVCWSFLWIMFQLFFAKFWSSASQLAKWGTRCPGQGAGDMWSSFTGNELAELRRSWPVPNGCAHFVYPRNSWLPHVKPRKISSCMFFLEWFSWSPLVDTHQIAIEEFPSTARNGRTNPRRHDRRLHDIHTFWGQLHSLTWLSYNLVYACLVFHRQCEHCAITSFFQHLIFLSERFSRWKMPKEQTK